MALQRIASKEFATTHFVKKWHPPECLFYKTKSGCRFGEKCSYAHRQVDEQPTKRSEKNDDKSAVAMLKNVDHLMHDNSVAYFKTWRRRSLFSGSEDRDTILELVGKVQELQNEVNCMNGSKDFQDVESVRSGHSHVQLTSVFPTSSSSWWDAKPFSGNAEPQEWAAKHLGHTWFIGKTFLQIQQRLLQHLIRRSWIHGVPINRNTHHHMWWVRTKHEFRIRDASQDRQPEIQSSLVRRFFKELWSRPTTTADFGSSFRQFPHTSNVCLLEDKIQDWGLYLFAISHRSHAVDH